MLCRVWSTFSRAFSSKPPLSSLKLISAHIVHSLSEQPDSVRFQLQSGRLLFRDSLSVDLSQQQIQIEWLDQHRSQFTIQEILRLALLRDPLPQESMRTLWSRATLDHPPVIEMKNFSLAKFASLFVEYGVVCVGDVQASAAATEEFCRSVAPSHQTFYGDFFVFNNKAQEQKGYHADTAYTNEEIGPHTDGTYFSHPPGIQVFHCLHPAERGGETLLVDGFAAAKRLSLQHSDHYRTLTTTVIDHHFIENGPEPLFTRCNTEPIIKLDNYGRFQQIRFNPYDRAPISIFSLNESNSHEDIVNLQKSLQLYEAYEVFSRICNDAESAVKVPLSPGTVIFIDNYRILHARAAFSGFREMCGCYLSRGNFMAKALPLLNEDIRLQL